MHVIGRTKSGKSRFLASLLKQDMVAGNGLCLLDPHGELVDYLVSWMAWDSIGKTVAKTRNVRVITLDDPDTTFCFNPLAINAPDEANGAAATVVDAFATIYGANDPSQTPQITDIMGLICKSLALQGLPLMAAESFLNFSDQLAREDIARATPDPYLRNRICEIASLPRREYRETVESVTRRFNSFFEIPIFRRILSTTENTIDLRHSMETGEILLFDLRQRSKRFGARARNAFGQFLVNQIVAISQERETLPKPRPFFLYLDEMQNFVSSDIGNILEECRKYGLFLTLAHQHLGQLIDAGEAIYRAVMSSTALKAVFGVDFADASVFADELFAHEVDFQRVKEKITSPQVIGHQITTLRSGGQSKSTGDTRTEAEGENRSQMSANTYGSAEGSITSTGGGSVESSGLVTGVDSGLFGIGEGDALSMNTGAATSSFAGSGESFSTSQAATTAEGQGVSKARARSESTQTSYSEGWAQALEPIIKMVATQTYSLEEQRYDLSRRLSTLKPREAYFGVVGHGAIPITTLDMPDMPHMPIAQRKLRDALNERTPFLITAQQAEAVQDGLRERIQTAEGAKPVIDEGDIEPP